MILLDMTRKRTNAGSTITTQAGSTNAHTAS
jgi:hypothetical protein